MFKSNNKKQYAIVHFVYYDANSQVAFMKSKPYAFNLEKDIPKKFQYVTWLNPQTQKLGLAVVTHVTDKLNESFSPKKTLTADNFVPAYSILKYSASFVPKLIEFKAIEKWL